LLTVTLWSAVKDAVRRRLSLQFAQKYFASLNNDAVLQ